MKNKAVIRLEIEFSDPSLCKSVLKALEPEIRNPPSSNVFMDVERKDSKLVIILESGDLGDLRAGVNSILYWFYAMFSSLEKV